MATWFVDPQDGSSLNGGTSAAVLITSTDGVANGTTTFTSATGGFTGKENHAMWIQTKNVRRFIVTVNSDTSVVLSGTVTAGSGLTFKVGGALKQVPDTAINAAGDTFKIKKSADQYNICDATFTSESPTITLATAKNARIEAGSFPWTPATNVTSANTGSRKAGTGSASLAVAAAFTTGLAGYQRLYTRFQGGTPSASETFSGSSINNLFDDDYATYWRNNNSDNSYVIYQFASGKTIQNYAMFPSGTTAEDPSGWTLHGSNNGTDWTLLDTRTTISLTQDRFNWYAISSPGSYSYYKWTFTDNNGTGEWIRLRQLVYDEGAYDFSAYQQITLHIYMSSGATTDGLWQVKLCSDTAGATPVDTFTIPTIQTVNVFVPVTIDKGSALGSSISSVALYAVSDPVTPTVYLNNISACKAPSSTDCLSLTCIVGKGGNNPWYTIDSIDGVTLKIGAQWSATTAAFPCEFYGTTETVPMYVIQPLIAYTASAGNVVGVTSNGTSGSHYTISGGWNFTSGLQDGISYIRGSGNVANGASAAGDYCDYSKLGFIHFAYGIYATASYLTFDIEDLIHASSANIMFTGSDYCSGSVKNIICAASPAVYYYNSANYNTLTVSGDINGAEQSGSMGIYLATNCTATEVTVSGKIFATHYAVEFASVHGCKVNVQDNIYNSGLYAVYFAQCHNCLCHITAGKTITGHRGNYDVGYLIASKNILNNVNVTAGVNGAYAFWLSGSCPGNVVNNVTASGYALGLVGLAGDVCGTTFYINRYTGTLTLAPASSSYWQNDDVSISCDKYNAGAGLNDHRRMYKAGTVQSETSVRHTASGLAWKLSPTVTGSAALYSLRVSLGLIYLTGGTTYTVTVYARRTNTGLTGTFRCRGAQLPGIATDVTDSISALADTWEQLSLTLSPTESGMVELDFIAYGGTTYSAYVDDMAISES